MKKNSLLLLAMATMGLFSCSDKVSEESASSSDGITEGFVAFNINTVNDTRSTRAEGDTPNDADFEVGTSDEYAITTELGANVVFFFDNNKAYHSKSVLQLLEGASVQGKDVSYEARIIKAKDEAIESCIMVLNADPVALEKLSITAGTTTLQGFVQMLDENLGKYGKYFTMSNSIYLGGEADNMDKLQGPVSVKGKICSSIEEAEKNKITVYVERVLAKFGVTFTNENGSILSDNNIIAGTGTLPVKLNGTTAQSNWGVRINGWNVNGTETATYLVKNLFDGNNFQMSTETMTNTNFGKWGKNSTPTNGYGWNDYNRFRSYWAIDPHYNKDEVYPQQYRQAIDNVNLVYADGKTGLPLNYISYEQIGKADFRYAPENTFAYNWFTSGVSYDYQGKDYQRTSTHILVAAQLLLGEELNGGTVADKYCYEGAYWANINELKKYMVEAVLLYDYKQLYNKDGEKVTLTEADFILKAATVEGGDGRIMLVLNTEVYDINGTAVDFADAIFEVGTAQHFKEGKMYYYIPIKHMAAIGTETVNGEEVEAYNVGAYGVVRNHWYKVNVSEIKKPGTPVDDPDQPIIPNDEPDRGAYASFEIVIIPWHIISDDDVKL